MDGPHFGGLQLLDPAKSFIRPGEPFVFEVVRTGNRLRFLLDGRVAYEMAVTEKSFGKVGFTGGQGAIHLFDFGVEGDTYELDWQRTLRPSRSVSSAGIRSVWTPYCPKTQREPSCRLPVVITEQSAES